MADKNEEKEIKDFLALLSSSIEENDKLLSAIEGSLDKNDRNQRTSKSRDEEGIRERLHDANKKLETLQNSCKTNQVKLEKALKKQHQSRTSVSSDREKPRLTEEEQDIAYELKAQMMRSTLVQNAKLKNELGLVQRVAEIRAAQRNKAKYDSTLSRTTLLNLMRKYEKENKEGW